MRYCVYSLTAAGPAYVYDSSGQPIYQVVEGISAVDLAGNFYYARRENKSYTIIKWDPLGRRVASFNLSIGRPLGDVRIEGDGTIYCLTMDAETRATYYIVRAQPK